jgi:hypothetical protein
MRHRRIFPEAKCVGIDGKFSFIPNIWIGLLLLRGGGGLRAVRAFCNRTRSAYSMMRWAEHAAYVGEAGNFYEISSKFGDQDVRY